MTENQMREVAEKVDSLWSLLEQATSADFANVSSASTEVVTGRDTHKFNVSVDMLSRDDVKNLRRELTSAIVAEKWTDGFVAAVKLMVLFGAL